jgi:hypothetical protein
MLGIDQDRIGKLYRFHDKMYTYPIYEGFDIFNIPKMEQISDEHWAPEGEIVMIIGGHRSRFSTPSETHSDHIDYYVIHRPAHGPRLAEVNCFLRCAEEID